MPPSKRSKTASKTASKPKTDPFTLRYFPLMAKGLGPALVAEFSGLPWIGSKDAGYKRDDWEALKPTTPFGQLPLLTTAEGVYIAQTTAIINFIGKTARTEGEGHDFAVSQMLLAEAEDIYALMQKFVPTTFVKSKGSVADYDAFWSTKLPMHLEKLEKLCQSNAFTTTGETPGELYLFSALHQALLVRPELLAAPKGKQPAGLAAWYAVLKADERTQKVLSGASSMGDLAQYFQPLDTSAMGEVAAGVSFDIIAREWRCKWSEDSAKASLAQAQVALDETVGALKALRGVREVKRVVCGGCHDLKVVIAFDKAAFDETVGGLEAKFLADLGKIEGIASIETQTYTFMSV